MPENPETEGLTAESAENAGKMIKNKNSAGSAISAVNVPLKTEELTDYKKTKMQR